MQNLRYKNYRNNEIGQGMTEYIIIVALIALAAIAGVKFYGNAIQGSFAGMTATLSGGDPAAGVATAETAANSAQTDADRERGLNNYHQ